MVEDLVAGTRDLYAQSEERLLGIIARQFAAGLDAPGWAERKPPAVQTVTLLTDRHASIMRTVEDGYRSVVAEVTAPPLLGTGTRRHATQDAMRARADRGITSFTLRTL